MSSVWSLILSCKNSFLFRPKGRYAYYGPVKIKCRWCMSCRVANRTHWQDRIEQEHFMTSSGMSFVTFTYDDNHLYFKSKHALQPSLCKSDVKQFLDALRYRLKSKGVPVNSVCNFKYYCVGEYGDQFGRPHYHFIFDGIDYRTCADYLRDCWHNGLIDVLPVLDGGIRYVLKYLDKQLHGDQAEVEYDCTFRERPFNTMSNGIGLSYWDSTLESIMANDWRYSWKRRLSPVSTYYKNLFLGSSSADYTWLESFAASMGFKNLAEAESYYYVSHEKMLRAKALNEGKPVYPEWHNIALNPKTNEGYAYADYCTKQPQELYIF